MVTLAVIAILSVLIVPKIVTDDSLSSDLMAKASLKAYVDNQSTIYSAQSAFALTPENLNAIDNERTFVSSETTSIDANTVSMAADSSKVAAAALSSTGTCWYTLKDFEDATKFGQLWAYEDNAQTCNAATALTLIPGEGRSDGSSASNPINLN